jgi:transcriptional regulator with XRE-family HTH domain
MEFGEFVKDLRKAQRMSASELARKSGISQPYLSQLETGKNNNPTSKMVESIAKGLGIPDLYEMYLRHKDMKEEHDQSIEIHKELVEKGFTTAKKPTLVYAIEDIFTDEMLLDYKGQYLTIEEKKEILSFIDYLHQKKNR